jgi:hypothetical protein
MLDGVRKHTAQAESRGGSIPPPRIDAQQHLNRPSRNPSKIYKFHVENLREIEKALDSVARLAKQEIAQNDSHRALNSLLMLHTFLIGAWAECRLKKLLHEQFGFSESERAQIEAKDSQLDQWKKAVETAFRKHYNLKRARLNQTCLGVSKAAYYAALQDALNDELRNVIEIRNKLAHGQWVYPLNSQGTSVEPDKYRLLRSENLLTLQLKYSLVCKVADTVHDLVVSPPAFERDFDAHFKRLDQARIDIKRRKYSVFRDRLVNSRYRDRQNRVQE